MGLLDRQSEVEKLLNPKPAESLLSLLMGSAGASDATATSLSDPSIYA